MKRLLLFPFLITLLLSSCSGKRFNSEYEAQKACGEWEEKGFWYEYEWIPEYAPDRIDTYKQFSRKCISDTTNQYVGEENISVKKNFYDVKQWKELKKNIKYKYKNFYF